MMLFIVIAVIAAVSFGVYRFLAGQRAAVDAERNTLAAQGFSPCPERRAEIERRYNDLATTTGQGGHTLRDPFCAEVAGHPVFFFMGVPPPRGASGSGVARPRPVFMLPFTRAASRVQVWMSNSAIDANPMIAKKIGLALSVLDYETPGSTLVGLDVPPTWKARNVIGAIGAPGSTLDGLFTRETGNTLALAEIGRASCRERVYGLV